MEEFTSSEMEQWTSQEPEIIVEETEAQQADPVMETQQITPDQTDNWTFTSTPEFMQPQVESVGEILDPIGEVILPEQEIQQIDQVPTPTPVTDDIQREQLRLLEQIAEKLDGSSVVTTEQDSVGATEVIIEEQTEETTDYVKEMYKQMVALGDRVERIETNTGIIASDNQLIGKISVGSSLVILGALVVYFFLGRIR